MSPDFKSAIAAYSCTTSSCPASRAGFLYRPGVCSGCQQPLVEAFV